MTSRKKFRFGERNKTGPHSGDPGTIELTQEDARNLDEYIAKIGETIRLLRLEINAIKDGHLDMVSDVFEEKSRMLKWLELRTPLIEPFLKHEAAKSRNLDGHLTELKKNIEEDGAMLSRMAIAARTIQREVQKINDRNGLDGVYGKSGQKLSQASPGRIRIDRQL